MLIKLMKHDFRYSAKLFLALGAIAMVLAAILGAAQTVNRPVAKLTQPQSILIINNTTNQVEPKQKSFESIAVSFGNNLKSLDASDYMFYLHADAGDLFVRCFASELLFFS